MKNTVLAMIILVFIITTGTNYAFAQSSSFTYQGRLQDGGTNANGNYDFQFTLWDALTGGTQQPQPSPATVTKTNVAVATGIFTVQLDFGASAFPGADRFLETGVRLAGGGSFTILSPRQPITSTPYAVRSASTNTADVATTASNATQLGGVAASQYVITSDSRLSDSRTPTAGSSNYIQNATSQQASSNFNVSGDGTAGGTISGNVVNATAQFNLNAVRVLSVSGGISQFQNSNTFAGIGSGSSNTPSVGTTSGNLNSFFGNNAGHLNTTGGENSFFGALAGNANANGIGNSFFGDFAGASNTGGSNNSFFGSGAGFSSTGAGNSFFGQQSGNSNSAGARNSFFGTQAGIASSLGNDNSFFGVAAGFANTTGSSNTIIGSHANVGANNLINATAIGANAEVDESNALVLGGILGFNAGSNTAVGIGTTTPSSLFGSPARFTVLQRTSGQWTQHIGTNNFSAGNSFGLLVDAGTNSADHAFRIRSQGGAVNFFTVRGDGLVGIGTDSPGTALDVLNSSSSAAIRVRSTAGSGVLYLDRASAVPANSAQIAFNSAGSPDFTIGTSQGSAGVSDFSIYNYGTGSNALTIQKSNGNVGVGAASPAVALEVRRDGTPSSDWQTGQLRISGNSDPNKQLSLGYDTTSNAGVIQAGQAFTGFKSLLLNPFGGGVTVGGSMAVGGDMTVSRLALQNPTGSPGATAVCVTPTGPPYIIVLCSSSYRYKTNISNYRAGYDVIRRLNPIGYDWKQGGSHDIGLGAEDVEKVDPRLVVYNDKGQVEGVKYDRIGVVLINAVKEQQAHISRQQEQLKQQQEQIKRQQDQAKQQAAELQAQQRQLDALKKLLCRSHPHASMCK